MSTKTLYPLTLAQSSETNTNFREFNNLNRVKNSNNTYAKTGQIDTATGTHNTPSTITATNFQAKIPAGSKINKITVEYEADYEDNVNIGKPTVSMQNIIVDSQKGKTLTTTMTKTSVSWSGEQTLTDINSADFGVTISFPANKNNDTGYVNVNYIRIIIDYTAPNYSVNASKVEGTYTNDNFKVKVTASNVNRTNGDSTVTIQLPSGTSYQGKEGGDGTISVSGSYLTWIPGLSNKTLTSNIILNINITTNGDHQFNINESVSGHSTSLTISTSTRPAVVEEHDEIYVNDEVVTEGSSSATESTSEAEIEADYTTPIHLSNEYIDITWGEFSLISHGSNQDLSVVFTSEFPITVRIGFMYEETFRPVSDTSNIPANVATRVHLTGLNYDYIQSHYPNITGTHKLIVRMYSLYNTQGNVSWYFTNNTYNSVDTPYFATAFNMKFVLTEEQLASLTTPPFSILQLTDEELQRLGNGVTYTVQSFLKHTTSEAHIADLYKNFRLAVFNNRISENIVQCLEYEDDFTVDANSNEKILECSFDSNDIDFNNVEMYASSEVYFGDVHVGPNGVIDEPSGGLVNYFSNDSLDCDLVRVDDEDVVSFELILKKGDISKYVGEFEVDFENEIINEIRNDGDPTDYTDLDVDEIFTNAEYWSDALTVLNDVENVTIDFPYNKDYPLYILFTGAFPEQNLNSDTLDFTEPCIVETDDYAGYETNGNYPSPLNNLVTNDEPSVLNMGNYDESSGFIVYNPNVSEGYGTNDDFAVRGIELTADIDYTDDLTLFAKLKIRQNNQLLIGNRSVILSSEDDTLTIGGKFDTWGLQISELTNLDKLEVEFTVNDVLELDEPNIHLRNIQLNIYTAPIDSQTSKGIMIGDENVGWYGMQITDIEIPFGRNSETKYLNVEGTDTNVAYRQIIRSKKIKVSFELDSCDLTESTEQLQQIVKLVTNKRDELNSPIPKSIRFKHIPDKIFYYILEDTLTPEILISDYKATIELTIPDGTAFDVEDTVVNKNGYVDTIAAVNPIIVLSHITDTQMTISEVVNNQVFNINQENLTNGVTFATDDVVTIDCASRTCSIVKAGETESTDISEAVDFHSDWFKLDGEFEFNSENCVIQTITYNKRS